MRIGGTNTPPEAGSTGSRPPSRATAASAWKPSRPACGGSSPLRAGRWSPGSPTSPTARTTTAGLPGGAGPLPPTRRYSNRAADMPGADDLMMRIYAAMAQKEREPISERTKAALAAARVRGAVLGGDRGYPPAMGPDAAAASRVRRDTPEQSAYRLVLEIDRLREAGVSSLPALARTLTERGIATPRRSSTWTHTTVARVIALTSKPQRVWSDRQVTSTS